MNLNKIGPFLSNFATDPTLSDASAKAMNGAEALLKEMEMIRTGFVKHFDNNEYMSDRWITIEFPDNVERIANVFKLLRDFVRPLPKPININDEIVQRRMQAGKILPKDQTFLDLGSPQTSAVNKLLAILDRFCNDYTKEVREAALASGFAEIPFKPNSFSKQHRFANGAAIQSDTPEWVPVSMDVDERHDWAARTKIFLENLNSTITTHLI